MRIRLAIPDGAVTAKTLGAALEAATVANQGLASRGALPDLFEAIKRGVKWRPERFTDGEHFDLAPLVASRGWGDCDDLAPWLAAQLRTLGHDCQAIAYKSGPTTWHAVVQMADGKILDPSQWAGMKKPGTSKGRDNPGISGIPYAPLGSAEQDVLALVPDGRGGWAGRADIYTDDGFHVSNAGFSRDPRRALERAVAGYSAYAEGCAGGVCGPDSEVGSFLSDVVSTVAPIASSVIPGGSLITKAVTPLASNLLSALSPGGGAQAPAAPAPPPGTYMPGGAPARHVYASAPMPPLPGRGDGSVQFSPFGGPIIVRF